MKGRRGGGEEGGELMEYILSFAENRHHGKGSEEEKKGEERESKFDGTKLLQVRNHFHRVLFHCHCCQFSLFLSVGSHSSIPPFLHSV